MNGFAALDIHPHRRYVVDIGGRRSSRCRLHINFALFLHSLDFTQNLGLTLRVYLRSQKCWDIRQKAPDARRMSAALLGGMQANATQQMGLLGRIEQRWRVFRYTLECI